MIIVKMVLFILGALSFMMGGGHIATGGASGVFAALVLSIGGSVAFASLMFIKFEEGMRAALARAEHLQAKLHRLQSTNHHIANMLSNAERAGGETDQPEGTRYITLSDTLARQIAKELTAEDDEK